LRGNCWENGEANMENFRNMLETEGFPPKLSGNWCDVSSSSDWWKVQPPAEEMGKIHATT